MILTTKYADSREIAEQTRSHSEYHHVLGAGCVGDLVATPNKER